MLHGSEERGCRHQEVGKNVSDSTLCKRDAVALVCVSSKFLGFWVTQERGRVGVTAIPSFAFPKEPVSSGGPT